MQIIASAEAMHDTNVARSGPLIAQRRGINRADNVFTPGLDLNIVQPIGRQAFFLSGSAAYDFHQQNRRLDRGRVNVTSGVAVLAGPCQSALAGNYSRRLSNLEDEIDLTPVIVNNVVSQTAVSAQLTCGLASGLALQASGAQSWAKNSLAQRVEADNDQISGQLGLSYRRPALGALTVFGRYSKATFPNRLLGTPLIRDGFEIRAIGARYEKDVGRRLKLGGGISYQDLRPNVSTVSPFKGTAARASVTFTPSSRLTATASYVRSLNASEQGTSTYQEMEKYTAEAAYKIGTALTLSAGASRSDRSFKGTVIDPLRQITDSRLMTYTGSAAYKMGRILTFSLNVQHDDRDANLTDFSYVGDQITIKAEASF